MPRAAPRAKSRTIVTEGSTGATGRVGTRIAELAHQDAAFALVGAVARPGSARVGAPAAAPSRKGEPVRIAADAAGIAAADVVIDFSSDAGAARALALAERAGASLLVGTTALSEPISPNRCSPDAIVPGVCRRIELSVRSRRSRSGRTRLVSR